MSETQQLAESVHHLLATTLRVEPGDLTPDTSLGDLGMDSLAEVEISMVLQDDFQADIAPGDFREETVGGLVQLVIQGRSGRC
ncbi:acyl carrier protein [Streptomyces sp. NPDC040724]|uniref:acyl carrier protein n=1 Tax=unclassified Streptomyces TaxID=2593676 RepID=UPI0033C70BE4